MQRIKNIFVLIILNILYILFTRESNYAYR